MENTWLSNNGGFGVQKDYDWFQISISTNALRLVVHLLFSDVEGDIDISVYNSVGTYITGSSSVTDNEYIDYTLPSIGTYYLRVYGDNTGNTYDLLWDDYLTIATDDFYENNDNYLTATDISTNEREWLSSINSLGIQSDSDFYEISITSNWQHLVVFCIFSDAAGNIDLELWDSTYTIRYATSWSTTDNEVIDYIVPSSGTYYIRVYYGNGGNTYDLWWDDLPTSDDDYEENDLRTSAYDLSSMENTWLSSMALSLGVQSDYDWYEIFISPGEEHLAVSLSFSDAAGNINIQVYDSIGSLIIGSSSTTDDEYIDLLLPSSGTYYLRIYGDNAGNLYDLWWDDLPRPSDDAYEENDNYLTAFNHITNEMFWLTEIDGAGIQADDDWYEISITPGYERLVVDLTFTDVDGNINVQVYASDGTTVIAGSYSTTNNEYIDIILPSDGTYYLRVYGDNAGNLYDLWWDDGLRPSDDAYEENDVYSSAYDHTLNEIDWLTEIDGAGIQADDDWYEISISSGFLNLVVDLRFIDADGDIDIRVYASDGTTIVASGFSITDNEYINTILPSSGIYYLRVYGDNAGNLYNLWWDDLIPPSDDNYEENDVYTSAYDLSSNELTWLNTIDGFGTQSDDDWYEISITPGYEHLMVNCTFTHAAGDIDVVVYFSDGTTVITGSLSVSDNEYIDYILPSSGTYFIFVFGDNAGNQYNLWWDDLLAPWADDNYEENDADTTAYDLTMDEQTWLNTIDGYGMQYDYDWYEIYVTPGYENVLVDLQFTHASGNMDLGLINSSLSLVAASTSSTDNEYIDIVVSSAGTYYIYIEGDDAGNTYDLWWDDTAPGTGDDAYEPNDLPAEAYDLTAQDGVWLNTISGMGIQSDWDFYEIYMPSGYERLVVECLFTHSAGNISLIIWNSTIDIVAWSYSETDNEYFDEVLPSSGTYYILVKGDDTGNSYNLMWDALAPVADDPYEENDLYTEAFDLTSYPDTWLTAISGPGIQADFDFYRVSVTTTNQRLIIDLTYTYSEGPLILMLTDSALTTLMISNTTANNEHIDQTLTSTGTFYIVVAGLGSGTSYDLKYNLSAAVAPENPIPGYDLIFFIAVVFGISIILLRNRTKKLTKI